MYVVCPCCLRSFWGHFINAAINQVSVGHELILTFLTFAAAFIRRFSPLSRFSISFLLTFLHAFLIAFLWLVAC